MREENTVYHACAGQVILLDPQKTHVGTVSTNDVDFYWVHFHLRNGTIPFQKRFFERFENTYLFKELLHYNNLPNIPKYLVNSILTHILAELSWIADNEKNETNSMAERIYEWIRINANARLSVERVAAHFGYSSDHISRICKKYYGAGARQLINRFLMARAKELLCNTDKYIKEIAADLEFQNDKTFIAYFKYHQGCFPSEFRNRFGKIHMNNR